MMENTKKTKTIAFRVSEKDFAQIERAAQTSGKNPNDWCRDLALADAGLEDSMTLNEKIIFEEVSKLRYLVGLGFGLLSTGKLDKNSWEEIRSQADTHGEEIAAQLLTRRQNKPK